MVIKSIMDWTGYEKEKAPEFLIFGGGGARILGAVSALTRLIEAGAVDLKKVKMVSGVSAGALLGTLLACGADEHRYSRLMPPDLSVFKDDRVGYLRDSVALFRKYGICRGQTLEDWVEETTGSLTGYRPDDLTFRELYEWNGKALYVWTYNVNYRRRWCFSPFHHGDTLIAKAVHASCAIPGFYQPVEINGDLHTDGGWVNNYPDIPGTGHLTHAKLGFKLTSPADQERIKIKRRWDFPGFLGAHIDGAMATGEQLHVSEALWANTVKINTGNIKATDLKLTNEQRRALVDAGVAGAEAYLADRGDHGAE